MLPTTACRPSGQTAHTLSHVYVPLRFLELPDENLVDHVPLSTGPADKQPITLSYASVPLSYLELPDENLVYNVPLLAGQVDNQPLHYLMPLSL
jgi:hypothetical protein